MTHDSANYFVPNRTRNRSIEKPTFKFRSTRINNSPYVVVQGPEFMQLVKEGAPNEVGFKHIGTCDMNKTLARPDFLTTMGGPVNDERFNLSD